MTTAEPVVDPNEKDETYVLTPEVMEFETERHDRFIALGVLIFAFFLGCFLEIGEEFWLHLTAGRLVAETFPQVPGTDSLAYTTAGEKWIQPSWLFDWAAYQIHERLGATALGLMKSLGAILIALFLMGVRHSGPTRWWAALVAAATLVALARFVTISPMLAGMVLMAASLWMWFLAESGRSRIAVFGLPLLTLVWVNVDLSFIVLPVWMTLMAIGRWIEDGRGWLANRFDDTPALSARAVTLVAALCWLATLGNPWGFRGLLYPFTFFAQIIPGYGRAEIARHWANIPAEQWMAAITEPSGRVTAITSLTLIILAAIAFQFNYRRWQLTRILMFFLGVACPFVSSHFLGVGLLLVVATLSLNSQEAYLGWFGRERRIEFGWLVWSQGGRALTIVGLFLLVFVTFTGRLTNRIGLFGLGIAQDRYPVEGVEFLRETGFQGRIYPFTLRASNYIAWALPGTEVFVDSRPGMFQGRVWEEFVLVQRSLIAGQVKGTKVDPAKWKPIFDQFGITHILFDPQESNEITWTILLNHPDFRPMHISDRAIILGRTEDTSANVDREIVRANLLEPNEVVFRNPKHPARWLPTPQRLVNPPGWLDWVWQLQQVIPRRLPTGIVFSTGFVNPADEPGATYLAVQNLREAAAENPEYSMAHLMLGQAFTKLYAFEFDRIIRTMMAASASSGKQVAGNATPSPAPEIDSNAAGTEAETSDGPAQVLADPKVGPNVDPGIGPTIAPSGVVGPLPTPLSPEDTPPIGEHSPAASSPASTAGLPDSPAATDPTQAVSQGLNPETLAIIRIPHAFSTLRHVQMATAFQDALLAGANDWRVHLNLANLWLENQFFDAALRHYRATLEELDQIEGDRIEPMVNLCRQRIAQLEPVVNERQEAYAEFTDQMRQEAIEAQVTRDLSFERSQVALLRLGLLDQAIEELEKMPLYGEEAQSAAPFATRLYIKAGLPAKALPFLRNALNQQQQRRNMPFAFLEGEGEYWLGLYRAVGGNYLQEPNASDRGAIEYLQIAIRAIRQTRALLVVDQADLLLAGGMLRRDAQRQIVLSNNFALLEQMARESQYLYELGLLRLEAGQPDLAKEAFLEALEVNPLTDRRATIVAYVLAIDEAAEIPEIKPPAPEDFIAVQFAHPEATRPEAPDNVEPGPKPDANSEAGPKKSESESPEPASRDENATGASSEPTVDPPATAPPDPK